MRALAAVLPLTAFAALALRAEAVACFELHGIIQPAPPNARVRVDGASGAYRAVSFASGKGEFRFRKLPVGAYTVSVFAPSIGGVRRSVDVTAGLADARGRVDVIVPFDRASLSNRGLQARNTVSVQDLALSDRALKEYEAALRMERKQDDQTASLHLYKALAASPVFPRAWHELGTIACRKQDWAEAERCFRKALDLRPGATLSVIALGGVLLHLNRAEEALPYNRTGVDNSPANTTARVQLGISYFLLGRPRDAERELREAKRMDPAHSSNPQLALSEVRLSLGDPAGAIAELREFLALHPDSPAAETVRAKIARMQDGLSPPETLARAPEPRVPSAAQAFRTVDR